LVFYFNPSLRCEGSARAHSTKPVGSPSSRTHSIATEGSCSSLSVMSTPCRGPEVVEEADVLHQLVFQLFPRPSCVDVSQPPPATPPSRGQRARDYSRPVRQSTQPPPQLLLVLLLSLPKQATRRILPLAGRARQADQYILKAP